MVKNPPKNNDSPSSSSRERVRQIEKRAKDRLKTKLQNEAWVNEDE